ncbi:MAG: preprotein translocase subunit SecE [Phycisphaerales bacterium]
MNLRLLKPGQGYWVRIMTACLVAVVTLALAGWMYAQGGLIADKLPKSQYEMTVTLAGAAPAAGAEVAVLGSADLSGQKASIGSAKVMAFDERTSVVRVDSVVMTGAHEISEATGIGSVQAGAAPRPIANLANRAAVRAVAPIDPQVIQGVLAAAVLLLGAFVAYYFAGLRLKTVDFLIATDYEMKKVNWSTRREIMGSTWVVIGAAVLISASLFLFDLAFRTFFTLIGILAT